GEAGGLGRLDNEGLQRVKWSAPGGNRARPELELERASMRSTHSRSLRAAGLVEDTSGSVWFQPDRLTLVRFTTGKPEGEVMTNAATPPYAALVPGREPWLLTGDSLCLWTNGGWAAVFGALALACAGG